MGVLGFSPTDTAGLPGSKLSIFVRLFRLFFFFFNFNLFYLFISMSASSSSFKIQCPLMDAEKVSPSWVKYPHPLP